MYPDYKIELGHTYAYVRLWKHTPGTWIVASNGIGPHIEKTHRFYDDLFFAAQEVVDRAKFLGLDDKLPVEPGLRLVHRLNDWLEEQYQ